MIQNLTSAIQKKIDKSTWQTYRFDELVHNIVEKVSPRESGLEKYIGLEHLDSGSLKIRRFGSTQSIKGDKLKIYKGDLIFAKRNSYLKRVAIADEDAVASAHSLVLRAKVENVNPSFLPFFLLSESFWSRAIQISVGSLSPTINWKVLARQEFLLPPKDQQAELAELLWAMDEYIEGLIELLDLTKTHHSVFKDRLVLEGDLNPSSFSKKLKQYVAEGWEIKSLGELLKEEYLVKIQDGNHGEIHPKSSDYCEKGIPFIMANTLVDGKINFTKSKKLPESITRKLRIGFSYSGDILLSHKGTVGQVAQVPIQMEYPYLMLTPQVTLYRTNSKMIDNQFLFFVFSSNYFQTQLRILSSQSTRAYVGITAQKKLKIAIPKSLEEQRNIVSELKLSVRTIENLDLSIKVSKNLMQSIINQIF